MHLLAAGVLIQALHVNLAGTTHFIAPQPRPFRGRAHALGWGLLHPGS